MCCWCPVFGRRRARRLDCPRVVCVTAKASSRSPKCLRTRLPGQERRARQPAQRAIQRDGAAGRDAGRVEPAIAARRDSPRDMCSREGGLEWRSNGGAIGLDRRMRVRLPVFGARRIGSQQPFRWLFVRLVWRIESVLASTGHAAEADACQTPPHAGSRSRTTTLHLPYASSSHFDECGFMTSRRGRIEAKMRALSGCRRAGPGRREGRVRPAWQDFGPHDAHACTFCATGGALFFVALVFNGSFRGFEGSRGPLRTMERAIAGFARHDAVTSRNKGESR